VLKVGLLYYFVTHCCYMCEIRPANHQQLRGKYCVYCLWCVVMFNFFQVSCWNIV